MKQACCRHPRAKRGEFGIVPLIIVVVLVVAGVFFYMKFAAKKAQQQAQQDVAPPSGVAPLVAPSSLPGKVLRKAESFECQNNLRQLRQLIDMAKNDNAEGKYPESLAAMPESTKISACPVSREPYTYDPATGKVSCTCPGHENY